MIQLRLYFLFFLFCFTFPGAGQVHPVFDFQKDDPVVKKNYQEQSTRKKELLIAGVDRKNADGYKKIYESQFKEIGLLWGSDRSVTDPVAHGYLQRIVNRIVAANTEMRDTDARIVFSRDWWPNAYSMGDGSIAINAGLFVYLDNEAELVFVLCHELAHYYLDHAGSAIKKYVETVNSEAFQKELKLIAKTEYGANKRVEELTRSFAFSSRRHSRENEAEADRLAFSFMKNTGYDCNAIQSCLQLLDKVDDSLLFKPLDLQQVFNFNGHPFRKKWIQEESSIFGQMKEDDSPRERKEKDSLKTHPDCSKRIALLTDSIQGLSSGGEKFLVDKGLFHKLRKDFFVEITEQCYREKNLSRNLYYSLLLLQSGENLPVAVYSVARCLNTIYTAQKNHKLGTTIDSEKSAYPKDYNLLLRMLDKIRLEEIASLNFHFCKQYEQAMSNYESFEDLKREVYSLQ